MLKASPVPPPPPPPPLPPVITLSSFAAEITVVVEELCALSAVTGDIKHESFARSQTCE